MRSQQSYFRLLVFLCFLGIAAPGVSAGDRALLRLRVLPNRPAAFAPAKLPGLALEETQAAATQEPALRVLVEDVDVPVLEIAPVSAQRPLVAIVDLSPPIGLGLQSIEKAMVQVSRRTTGAPRVFEMIATCFGEFRRIEPGLLRSIASEFGSRSESGTIEENGWERLDGVRRVVEQLVEEHEPFDAVLITRDFGGGEESADPFHSLADALLGTLSNNGLTLDIVNLQSDPGVFSRVAESTGGDAFRVKGPDSLETLLQEILTEATPGYILSLDGSGLRPSPSPLPVRVKSAQFDAGFEWDGQLWPGVPGMETLTARGLRDADRLRHQRELLAEKQQLWEAITVGREVVRLSPLTLPDRLRLADLHVALGQSGEAIHLLEQARELFDKSWEIPYRLGLICQKDNALTEAAHFYQEALGLRSRQQSIPHRQAELSPTSETRQEPIQDDGRVPGGIDEIRLELAEALLKSEQVNEAESQVELVLARKPGDIPGCALLIRILRAKKRYEEATSRSLSLLELDPTSLDGLAGAGLSLLDLGRSEEALPYLSRAVSEDPLNPDLLFALSRCHRSLRHWREALTSIRRAGALQPERPDLAIEEVEILERSGDLAAAGRLLKDEAVRRDSDFQVWNRLARWQERRGDLKEAIASYQKALALSTIDTMPEIHQHLGILRLIAEGATKASLTDLEKAGIPDLSEMSEAFEPEGGETDGDPAGDELQGVVFPGGRKTLFRFAPFLEGRAESQDLLCLLFQYLLEVRGTPRRRELINFLKEYSRFRTWLRSNDLFAQEVSVHLRPEKVDIEKANRILSYFGARAHFDWRDPEEVVSVEIEDEVKHQERGIVLQLMGLNLGLLQSGSSLQLVFEEDLFPVDEGLDFLATALGQSPREEDFLVRWLEKPETMKLYVAMSQLPRPAQARLRLFRIPDLIQDILPGLWSYGAMLKFDSEGRLVLPGGPGRASLWADLVGQSTRNDKTFLHKLFTKDKGKALYYLAVLSQASPDVCAYVMSTRACFESLYDQVRGVGNLIEEFAGTRQYHDLGDLLLLLELRDGTPYFPGTQRIWEISGRYPAGSRLEDLGGLIFPNAGPTDEARLLHSMLDTNRLGSAAAGVRKYAVLKYLADISPHLLDERVGPALALSFDRLGGLFELVSDLGLDSASALTLLEQAERLDYSLEGNRRRTSIALFQAPLVLIQSLVRKGVLEKTKGRQLADDFLSLPFPDDQPGIQAGQVASFLRDHLKPEILNATSPVGSSPRGWLLQSLAGSDEEAIVYWDDEAYSIRLGERELKRLEHAFENQRLTPLDAILEAFSWLSQLHDSPESACDHLAQACSLLLEPAESEWTDKYRKAVVHTHLDNVRSLLKNLQMQSKNRERSMGALASELAEELSPFLAETLIGLVYATDMHGQDFFTQVEDTFSRKHTFATRLQKFGIKGPRPLGGTWGQPILMGASDGVGSRVEGSLVGISTPLTRLKTLGMTLESGRVVSLDFPETQRLSIQLINSSLLTDPVISYAGELIDMARYLVAAAAMDPGIRAHCEDFVLHYCGSKRADTFIRHLRAVQIDRAVRLLLPSERFFLAETYHQNQELYSDSAWYFHKSQSLIENSSAVTSEGLSQLGFPVLSWYGANSLSLELLTPVETLTTYNSPRRLAERTCELKLKLAHLFWQQGLPARLFEPVAQVLVGEVLAKAGQAYLRDWQAYTEVIDSLDATTLRNAMSRFEIHASASNDEKQE